MQDIPRADDNRLDPDGPWRYACPECGSVALAPLRGGNRDPTRTYPQGEAGKRESRRDRQQTIRCNDCGARFLRREIIDRRAVGGGEDGYRHGYRRAR